MERPEKVKEEQLTSQMVLKRLSKRSKNQIWQTGDLKGAILVECKRYKCNGSELKRHKGNRKRRQ
jgi:hypothetical protein